ncbi:hypothetical protein ACJZ2D_016432 [Fusarium nematophilum]
MVSERYGSGWGEGDNGWGLILTGNVETDFQSISAPGDMIATTECKPEGSRFDMFKKIAAVGKANGSLMVAQITHPGRQLRHHLNPIAVAPSAIQMKDKNGLKYAKPHAATQPEIDSLVEGFAYAAEYLEKAGFDGIELHAAHGYLLSQFLSRATNTRTDEYGPQTMESRLRFISEVARAIKARWTKDSTRRREAFFLEFAKAITDALGPASKLRVYLTGGFRSAEAMVKGLDAIHGVGIGRPAAAEPRLCSDILEGRLYGALKPVEAFENDIYGGLAIAGAQLAQIATGMEPLNFGDAKVMDILKADMSLWQKRTLQDGEALEYVRPVRYSGPQHPYGVAAE